MSKDREIQCVFYLNEGNCLKGHKGFFKRTCQKCKDYQAKKGTAPRRKNLKTEKNLKWMQDMRNFS